ncbi:hypothetical protein [Qipengyuania atrilutea]|uniref:Tetratricopeptide repeat protein n=1 Tax=Qipengyuania atrilutea TaxID=2744473 RepID=A0A850H019_9SPHN|nr:hypothetical protein [Actirhodobacter atriluteus]NVD43840.1 hypothetical protein [Actirhodobacter atriluteus]
MLSTFLSPRRRPRSRISGLALAIALTTGAAVTTAALETPAFAQKKKKKDETAQAEQKNYSDAFIAAYQPNEALLNAPTPDVAALQAAVAPVTAAATTPDDKFVAGNFVYNTGVKAQDQSLQLRGLEMMLASGKTPSANAGQFNYVAGSLAYEAEDYTKARQYIEAALAAGYSASDPTGVLVETYIKGGQPAEGLAFLKRKVDEQLAAGQKPDQAFLRRGLAVAYENNLADQARDFALMYAAQYPTNDSWGDAIVVTRSLTPMNETEMLDLLRLQRQTGTFRQKNELLEYVDALDARTMPGEVVAVIDEGYSSGLIPRSDPYAKEAYSAAQSRISSDRAELPGLERDASQASAKPALVVSAGDTFLNYDQPEKAEKFYRMALDKAGTDKNMLMTRIGIAQVYAGNYAEAQQTLEQVTGNRQYIAELWSAYAAQQANGTTSPATQAAVTGG